MANWLKMAQIESILSLRAQRWSFRRIARELDIHRETVARYVRLAESKPATALTGSAADTGAGSASDAASSAGEPAKAPLGPAIGHSHCEPWRDVILTKLDAGLSAQRIYQDLAEEAGFAGSYHSVRRFVRKLQARPGLPFRRMECGPGDEAQVDFGTAAPVVTPDGKRRKPYVFRIVLSHSRKAYCEVSLRQTTEDFIRCLENAFWHFGGVPKTLVIDNLRAAVKHPDWFDPELVPKLQAFCRHYGTVILPTKPYTPRHSEKQQPLDFVDEHPIIRPLADYRDWLGSALSRDRGSQDGFRRHDGANECTRIAAAAGTNEKSLDGVDRRGALRVIHPPRSGYPSSDHATHGARSAAEPDSVSPDESTVAHVVPLFQPTLFQETQP